MTSPAAQLATAPFATVESRLSRSHPLAVVFGTRDGSRNELLLVIDRSRGRFQAEYFSHDIEAEGTGDVTLRQLNDRTCVVIAQMTVRGFNVRTERCQAIQIDAAVTWSRDPALETVNVTGTALVLGSTPTEMIQLEALTGHSFNRFVPIGELAEDPVLPNAA